MRTAFRQTGVPVKHFAKDLGAHVAFSKHRTNQTLAQRLDSLGPFWTQLKASRASYQAKLRALRTVARGLFGVASAPLGASQWLRHRRLAVQSLSFDKPGVNPQVLLGLVEAIADPEWLSILMTVSETRALCPWTFGLWICTMPLVDSWIHLRLPLLLCCLLTFRSLGSP